MTQRRRQPAVASSTRRAAAGRQLSAATSAARGGGGGGAAAEGGEDDLSTMTPTDFFGLFFFWIIITTVALTSKVIGVCYSRRQTRLEKLRAEQRASEQARNGRNLSTNRASLAVFRKRSNTLADTIFGGIDGQHSERQVMLKLGVPATLDINNHSAMLRHLIVRVVPLPSTLPRLRSLTGHFRSSCDRATDECGRDATRPAPRQGKGALHGVCTPGLAHEGGGPSAGPATIEQQHPGCTIRVVVGLRPGRVTRGARKAWAPSREEARAPPQGRWHSLCCNTRLSLIRCIYDAGRRRRRRKGEPYRRGAAGTTGHAT